MPKVAIIFKVVVAVVSNVVVVIIAVVVVGFFLIKIGPVKDKGKESVISRARISKTTQNYKPLWVPNLKIPIEFRHKPNPTHTC